VSYGQFVGQWERSARLAWDSIALKPTDGIPCWMLNIMEWGVLERLAGAKPGDYEREPERVYRDCQLRCGVGFIDQWIPRNPLTIRADGYDGRDAKTATQGLQQIVEDGRLIDSPEAVAEHLEQVEFPRLREQIAGPEASAAVLIAAEVEIQKQFGFSMLKGPYDGFQHFPMLRYCRYGYENYFMAYALYPEIIAQDFRLQADWAVKRNAVAARAIIEGRLPPLLRLDHDIADSRGTLVDIKSLDRIWFPHFARAIEPFLRAGIRLIWHCDGNLMEMVPRLLQCGLGGFQGFQYEDGMDYEKICRMTDRDGNPLLIIGGVSVTRSLPLGTPKMVRDEINWLVRHGPPVGLMLGASSSIAPGVPWANLQVLVEGLQYYERHGKAGCQ
jgi:hypothetical protein